MKNAVLVLAFGCASSAQTVAPPPLVAATPSTPACNGTMRVHFYDAGQALATLVLLPDGKTILVDVGESPARPACGACKDWNTRVLNGLKADLGSKPIDLVWITHQHSDHAGGAVEVLGAFGARAVVDNGRDLDKPTIAKLHEAASKAGATMTTVDPSHSQVPLSSAGVTLRAMVPPSWPTTCKDSPNDCSIGLRIEYCKSSVLFTGDAEAGEEAMLDPGNATLLQVGHHGSSTSSTQAFLEKVHPSYAVVSAGKPMDGTNATYCHPRSDVLGRLTAMIGGATSPVRAFDGKAKCDAPGQADHWSDVPVSDKVWVTSRDGNVNLMTKGDSVFTKE